jgi:hypothetical protein
MIRARETLEKNLENSDSTQIVDFELDLYVVEMVKVVETFCD